MFGVHAIVKSHLYHVLLSEENLCVSKRIVSKRRDYNSLYDPLVDRESMMFSDKLRTSVNKETIMCQACSTFVALSVCLEFKWLLRLLNHPSILTELRTCVIRVTKAILCIEIALSFFSGSVKRYISIVPPSSGLQTLDDITIILAIVLTSRAGDDDYSTT